MDESKQDLLRSADAALTAFSCFFVIVRLLARQVSGAKWWWDDLAVVVAWAIVMTENGLGFWAISRGLGAHEANLGGPQGITNALYTLYLDQLMVHPCLASCKLAVCLFYGRVFSTPPFRRAIWVVAILTILWLMGTFPVIVLNCVPVKKIWLGPAYPGGHCVDLKAFLIGQAVPNTILDIALLVLPLTFIWQLQMSNTSKIAVSFVFCVGIFETTVSIIRLVMFTRMAQFDPTYSDWQSELWSRIEVNVGLICTCLMGSAPLLKRAVDSLTSLTTGRSNKAKNEDLMFAEPAKQQRSWAKGGLLSAHRRDFARLDNVGHHGHASLSDESIAAARAEGRDGNPKGERDAIQLDEIHVTREVTVSGAPLTKV